jgi:hypothetical protein
MKLELTTWQRMACIQALNAMTGHISLIRKGIKLLDILEMSEQERVEIGMVLQDDVLTWQDKTRKWPLEITDGNLAEHLRRAVQGFQGWPQGSGREVVGLFDQLGIEDTE